MGVWAVRNLALALVLGTLGWGVQAQETLTADLANRLAHSVAKITVLRHGQGNTTLVHTGTGFLWGGSQTLVTAYHVVAGAYLGIRVEFSGPGRVFSGNEVRVVRVLRKADLALLELVPPAPELHPLRSTGLGDWSGVTLTVLGFPLNVPGCVSRPVPVPQVGPRVLSQALNPKMLEALGPTFQDCGIDLGTAILPATGGLLPGDSGAPIFNAKGEVVGIGQGGYFAQGTDSLAWAIPAGLLTELGRSGDSGGGGAAAPGNLWYSESEELVDQEVHSLKSAGHYVNVGLVRKMPQLALWTDGNLTGLDQEAFTGALTLSFRFFPWDYRLWKDDTFVANLLGRLDWERRTTPTVGPLGALLGSQTQGLLAPRLGVEGQAFFLNRALVLGLATTWPLQVQVSLGSQVVDFGWGRVFARIGLKVSQTQRTSYQFDYFGDARDSTVTRYPVDLFLGLGVSYDTLETDEAIAERGSR